MMTLHEAIMGRRRVANNLRESVKKWTTQEITELHATQNDISFEIQQDEVRYKVTVHRIEG